MLPLHHPGMVQLSDLSVSCSSLRMFPFGCGSSGRASVGFRAGDRFGCRSVVELHRPAAGRSTLAARILRKRSPVYQPRASAASRCCGTSLPSRTFSSGQRARPGLQIAAPDGFRPGCGGEAETALDIRGRCALHRSTAEPLPSRSSFWRCSRARSLPRLIALYHASSENPNSPCTRPGRGPHRNTAAPRTSRIAPAPWQLTG